MLLIGESSAVVHASPITVLRLLAGYGLEMLTYYHRVHNIPSPIYKSGTKAHYGVN